MLVGVPKESAEGERRVALVPEVVRRLAGHGIDVLVEAGAGAGAIIPDALYAEAGASDRADRRPRGGDNEPAICKRFCG